VRPGSTNALGAINHDGGSRRPAGWASKWSVQPSHYGPRGAQATVYIALVSVYTDRMAKHLVDLDEDALGAAQVELGTTTIRDTVNQALRRATRDRELRVATALDVLADAPLADRSEAWR
jgi:Arc/MetJ family transcription regulator